MLRFTALAAFAGGATACSFAASGLPVPTEGILGQVHEHFLKGGSEYPVLPRPVETVNNAFVTYDLQNPDKVLTGNDKSLLDNLADFAEKTKDEDLCYWAFQGLPPPRGGPTPSKPKQGYWDPSDGHNDQDIEWVQAYGEVAVSRLHSRIKKDGPVAGAMCAMGSVVAARRCENGASIKEKCIPAITNGTIAWPMAVSMWKVGHPDLKSAVQDWRGSSTSGHFQNIGWVAHTPGTTAAHAWNGTLPQPGEIFPDNMPNPWGNPASWPVSKDAGWGCPKIAKVVHCSDIPTKFVYNTDTLYKCDHMPSPDAAVSSVDEAYFAWRSLTGVWPPTKPCEDDQAALDAALTKLRMDAMVGHNCSTVYPFMQQYLPNFDCDNSDFQPTFRDICCSICGGAPIPDVPAPSPPPAEAPYHCQVCNHVYDPQADGSGKAFEDLPDTWVCPKCGAPKSAYYKQHSGVWAHAEK